MILYYKTHKNKILKDLFATADILSSTFILYGLKYSFLFAALKVSDQTAKAVKNINFCVSLQ